MAVVQEFARTIKNKLNIKCNFFKTASDVPDPRELDPEDKNLMIFNDLLLERQNKCECYYIRGRHSNMDCSYLSQNYFELPRQTIRENVNFICLFPQILKTLIISTTIMSARICQRKSLEDFVASAGKNCTVSLSSI